MLTLTSLDITSYDIDALTLTWAFSDVSASGFSISVYRSEAPSSDITEYDLIASGVTASGFSYSDTSVEKLYDPQRTWYYKLKIIDLSDLSSSIAPATPAYLDDTSTHKVFRRVKALKEKALRVGGGRTIYILKRRTWGTHCPDCYNSTLGRQTENECLTCFNTGWTGGYYDPITITGMINPAPQFNQITMFGEFMPSDCVLNMLNYPPLRPKDVVVETTNQRWIVRQVRPLEFQGTLLEQTVHLSRILPDDTIYDKIWAW
jgi:hypothetical protein